MISIYFLVIITVALAFIVIIMVNSLIVKKNQIDNAFAGIDAQLKKRYDLIPNLVAAAKEYMTHERGILEDITALRTKALENGVSTVEKMDIDNKLSAMMHGIMVQVENYPQLKASRNIEQLQRALNEVEEQLSAARRAYNAAVTSYNNSVEIFPSCIIAGILNYHTRPLFTIPENERDNVNVGALFSR